MFQPTHVDGRFLVILRRSSHILGSQFSVVASGQLVHGGETLELVGNNTRRVISSQELANFMLVKPDTRISECRGFDFFLVEE
jgi:hypothetical protein